MGSISVGDACELINLIQLYSTSKKNPIVFACTHSFHFQVILKYAYKLDVLIHQIVNMKYFNDTFNDV